MSKQNNIIDEIRKELKSSNDTELNVLERKDGLDEIWNEIQRLKMEMNEARRKAIEEAEKPYKEQLKELEEQYAMVLKLSAT